VRHLDVRDHRVRLEFSDRFHERGAVGNGGQHVELETEKLADSSAHLGMVVREYQAEAPLRFFRCGARYQAIGRGAF
jgi:hypothetical protein